MLIYNRTLVVDHHPPHTFIEYDADTTTLNTINTYRYAILEYEDTILNKMQYMSIPECVNDIDMTQTPPNTIPINLQDMPRMTMFNYDHLRNANLSFHIGDLPGRHVHGKRDIIVDGIAGDYKYLRNSLFVIGGLIHRSHTTSKIKYIIDGAITAKHHLSISRIYLPSGKVWREHDIKAEYIETTSQYIDDCIIKLPYPPGPLEVPLFVIGGYLVPVGKMITPLSNERYRLDFTNSQYLNRMVDQDGVIASSAMAGNNIDVNILKSDSHISEVLDASQSFVIYVKARNIHTHLYPVSQTMVPGRYIVKHPPVLPMLSGHGNIVDYVVDRSECNCYKVYTGDDRIKRYLASPTVDGTTTNGIDPTDLVYRRTVWDAIYVNVRGYRNNSEHCSQY